MLEIKVVLANLLRRFQFSLADISGPMLIPSSEVVLKPKHGVSLIVSKKIGLSWMIQFSFLGVWIAFFFVYCEWSFVCHLVSYIYFHYLSAHFTDLIISIIIFYLVRLPRCSRVEIYRYVMLLIFFITFVWPSYILHSLSITPHRAVFWKSRNNTRSFKSTINVTIDLWFSKDFFSLFYIIRYLFELDLFSAFNSCKSWIQLNNRSFYHSRLFAVESDACR